MEPKRNPDDPKWMPLHIYGQGAAHPHSPAAKSHDLSRPKCCLVCMRYVPKSSLTDAIKNGIHSLFGVEFDYSDSKVPLGICATCLRGIYDYNKTKVNTRKLELVHSSFDCIVIPPATRSEQVCTCEICTVVAKGPVKAGNFKKFAGAAKKVLSPIPENSPVKTGPAPKKQNLDEIPPCPHCLTPKAKGYPHPCDDKTLVANMLKIAEKKPTVGDRVAAGILKKKDPSPGGRSHLSLGAGSSTLKVLVNAPKGILQKKQVTAAQLHAFCLDLNLGIGKEKKMGAKLNEWFDKGTMETGYHEMLREMSRLVSGKVHVTELDFKKNDTDSELMRLPVWAVNDLNEYLSDIHENRDVDYSTTTILLGTDMGQKFLKFTLQVIDNAELEGAASNVKHKTTGVNRLHFFALCDKRVPENNFNVGLVFNLVKAHLVKYKLTSDLAMLNKFYGKQSCASMHPCYLCPAPKNDLLNPNYPLATHESAMRDYDNWRANSGDRKELKNYNNQEFPPVGVEHMSADEMQQPILLKSHCPPLHLLLSTNHLVSALETAWEFGALKWMRQAFQRFLKKKYFGGTLEGNQCSTLIASYGILDQLADDYGKLDIKPFVIALKALNSVKNACFGLRLDQNYVAIIDEFMDALKSLDEIHKCSVTVKFHMICIHVKQLCQMTNGSLQMNEQALESSHSRFRSIVQRFAGSDPDTDNPLFPLNVLRAMEYFNSAAAFRDSL